MSQSQEAAQKLRASGDQMRARGMLGKPDYHELGVRLAIALSMVEGVYSEAERCSDA